MTMVVLKHFHRYYLIYFSLSEKSVLWNRLVGIIIPILYEEVREETFTLIWAEGKGSDK